MSVSTPKILAAIFRASGSLMLLASLRALSRSSGVILFFLSVFCCLVFGCEGCGELSDFFACGDFGFAFQEFFAADVHGELCGRWDFEGFEGLVHFLVGDACFERAVLAVLHACGAELARGCLPLQDEVLLVHRVGDAAEGLDRLGEHLLQIDILLWLGEEASVDGEV